MLAVLVQAAAVAARPPPSLGPGAGAWVRALRRRLCRLYHTILGAMVCVWLLFHLKNTVPPPTFSLNKVLEDPEPFGVSTEELDLVAKRAALAMPVRYCMLMAVDGHLIHET